MLATAAKMYGVLPHELAWARRDVPGEDIDFSMIVLDMQCTMAYGIEREIAAKQARARRKK